MLPSRLPIILALGSLLFACSGADDADRQAAVARESEAVDPPGVAQALSLAGQFEEEEMTNYDRAIACAAALRISARSLAPMTSGETSREVQMIGSAANLFAKRAQSAEGSAGKNVSDDIEARIAEKQGDRTGQAQLAITCANSLG